MSRRRLVVFLIGGFAGFALILASLGIYGVLSYSVTQRRQELGIRSALGAPPETLRWSVLAETLRLTTVGGLIGLVGAWFLSGALAGLLFGVAALDPPTFFIVSSVVLGVAALAGYLPARRAARADGLAVLSA